MDWTTLKPQLADGSLFELNRSVFIQINPYRSKKIKKRSALLVTHELSTDTSKNLMLQRFKRRFFHKFKRATRSFSHEFASIFPFIVHPMILYINLFPKAIPGFLKSAVNAQKDEEYFERGYKVMYQGLDYVKELAYDCEIGIPMDKEGKYLDLVQDLMDHLEYIAKKIPDSHHFANGTQIYQFNGNIYGSRAWNGHMLHRYAGSTCCLW